jgi:hypothetical protein
MSAAQKLKRDAALLALLAGRNNQQAAEAAGVDDRTLRRWLHDPEFVAELNRHRRMRFGRTLNRYAAAGEVAVEVLESIARNPEEPAAARVAACKVLIAPLNEMSSSAPAVERLSYMQGSAGEAARRKPDLD